MDCFGILNIERKRQHVEILNLIVQNFKIGRETKEPELHRKGDSGSGIGYG